MLYNFIKVVHGILNVGRVENPAAGLAQLVKRGLLGRRLQG